MGIRISGQNATTLRYRNTLPTGRVNSMSTSLADGAPAAGTASTEAASSLDDLIRRINDGMGSSDSPAEPEVPPEFVPRQPQTLNEANLSAEEVEKIVCKLMASQGSMAGRKISEHVGLPFGLMDGLLR